MLNGGAITAGLSAAARCQKISDIELLFQRFGKVKALKIKKAGRQVSRTALIDAR